MTARRLLYLDSRRLSAYLWRSGKLAAEGVFTALPADLERFAAYLEAKRHSRFQLLANVGEEERRLETIPYLRGADRQALIARRLAQSFFGTPLTMAISLGYEKTRRRNERLLLVALTDPAHFEPWLAALAKAAAPLAGIHSLSQLGGKLLASLHRLPPRYLLLTAQDESLRESYIANGEALFSRLVPLPDASPASLAAACPAEAAKLRQYLLGQRQVGRDEPLTVFILAHPAAIGALRGSCTDQDQLAYTVLDCHRTAAALGLCSPLADSRSESLFLHLLATDAPRQQFAGEDLRHGHRLQQGRQALLAGGAATLLAALFLAAWQLHAARGDEDEALELAARTGTLKRRHGEIAAGFPAIPIDLATLRGVAARYADLQQLRRQPAEAYRLLARALAAAPAVELEGIEWTINADEGLAAPGTASETMEVRGSVAPAETAPTPAPAGEFERLLAALRSEPGLRVEAIQPPPAVESGILHAGENPATAEPSRQSFSLRITLPPPP